MGKFTKMTIDGLKNIPRGSGILLWAFDVTKGTFKDEDIICVTTGGVEITCKHDLVDDGDDIDQAPKNAKELLRSNGVDCGIKTTALEASEKVIRLAIGGADISEGKITPRTTIKDEDFVDIWHVVDMGEDGGLVATHLINSFTDDGLSFKTEKDGKGQVTISLKGYTSIDSPDTVPIEFYVTEAASA